MSDKEQYCAVCGKSINEGDRFGVFASAKSVAFFHAHCSISYEKDWLTYSSEKDSMLKRQEQPPKPYLTKEFLES